MKINIWTYTETTWQVGQQFTFYNHIHNVTVPEGMITDFASIPRLLWWMWPPYGAHGWPAVVHDWLYQTTGLGEHLTRKQCDEIFKLGLFEAQVSTFRRDMMFSAVRKFGQGAWDRYSR